MLFYLEICPDVPPDLPYLSGEINICLITYCMYSVCKQGHGSIILSQYLSLLVHPELHFRGKWPLCEYGLLNHPYM